MGHADFLILIAGAVTVAAADFKPMAQDSIVAKGAKTELVWAGGSLPKGRRWDRRA